MCIDDERLAAFLRSLRGEPSLPQGEAGALAEHLEQCPSCAKKKRGLLRQQLQMRSAQVAPGPRESRPPGLSDAARRRILSHEARLRKERQQAPELLARIEGHPVQRQLWMVRNPPFTTWGFCEHLLRRSWDRRFDDPEKTKLLAHLGVAVVEALDPILYGRRLVWDLTARAWAALGNACKLLDRYQDAERCFVQAEEALEHGTDDALEIANVLFLKASLRSRQERCQEALELVDRSIVLYREGGDRHQEGVLLAHRGMILGKVGHAHRALEAYRRALRLIDPEVDPRISLAVRHNLTWDLVAADRLDEARAQLETLRATYTELGDQLNLLRLRWLEGRMCLRMKAPAAAKYKFHLARQGFLKLGIGLDAMELSIELTDLYLKEGRSDRIQELATDLCAIAEAQDLSPCVSAAVVLFQQAVAKKRVTLELIDGFKSYLRKARHNPSLQPPPELGVHR